MLILSKIAKMMTFVFIALAFLPFVEASVYNIEFNQVDGKLLIKHEIGLEQEQTISLYLPEDATSISANLNYSINNNILTTRGRSIEISYITKITLEKSKEGYYFVDTPLFSFNVDEVKIKFMLKEGNFIEKDRVFPKPSGIETDGRQIVILWNLSSVKAGSDFPIFLTIHTPALSSNTLIIILAILAIILTASVAYLIYYFYSRKPKVKIKKQRVKEDLDKYLVESEKAVLHELKRADRGELWQKQLQIATNFSKAKLSRVIRNLEQRNLIEKISFGNTNKIRLK